MAALHPNRAADKRVLGYAFAGVVLDLRRQTLSVDGAEVASTPLMLRLLQLLCEADGHLLKRQELFDRLWPGGQDVSDSALSQLIWRLRTALGPYADLVATVRGSGLRLDAAVSTEIDFQRGSSKLIEVDTATPPRLVDAAAMVSSPNPQRESHNTAVAGDARTYGSMAIPPDERASPNAASLAPAPPRLSPRRRTRLLAVAIIAALVLLAAGALRWWPRDPEIIAAYALRASDLQASRPDTAQLIAAAFAARASDEPAHAATLLRGVHDADPSTPIPALFLAWWESEAVGAQPDWIDAARRRFTAQTSPYVRLLADYFQARRDDRSFRGPVNALLDLRPQAWSLQYARAHDQIATREMAGALRSLQQIDVDAPVPGVIADILVDRISLGDPQAEAIALRRSGIAGDPVLEPFVRGRAAYSRGDLAGAIAAFDRSRDAAQTRRQYARESESAIDAAVAAVQASAPDAARRLDAAARLCHQQDSIGCEVEMRGLQSFHHARAHEDDLARSVLAQAWTANPHPFLRAPLLFIALENGLPVPGEVEPVADAVPSDPVFGGVADLLRAWQAQAAGDHALARRGLELAREHGIDRTYHAEDALLLGARLGETVAPCRVDPPFPNVLRVAACVSLGPAAP
ncbi:MAG TPA: winged helix-turn-helix domain-containing protein [Rudaea sp.]